MAKLEASVSLRLLQPNRRDSTGRIDKLFPSPSGAGRKGVVPELKEWLPAPPLPTILAGSPDSGKHLSRRVSHFPPSGTEHVLHTHKDSRLAAIDLGQPQFHAGARLRVAWVVDWRGDATPPRLSGVLRRVGQLGIGPNAHLCRSDDARAYDSGSRSSGPRVLTGT